MNPATTLAKPLAATGARKTLPFHARIILSTLERMNLGCLHLELPDGSQRIFGQPNSHVQASARVVNWNFFKRCVLFGDVGFGEAYVDGDWETDDITRVIAWFILNIENSPAMSGSRGKKFLINLLGKYNRALHLLRPNSLATSRRNIQEHYDLGNNFYKLFLDSTMTYSSAWFRSPNQSLAVAQAAKYDRLCEKLKLKPTDHVLEIGSGWGGFSRHAVQNYGCKVTTVTISEQQYQYAQELFKREGLADRAEVKLMDYRLIKGQFDKIVSIEMLEAVGDKYLETYFAKCQEVLKPHGLLGVQMITCPDSRYDSLRKNVDWIQKHIFPGSLLLSVNRVNQAIGRTGELWLHDLHDMGLDYAETLKRWHQAFNQRLTDVRQLGFDERFIRKWNYYLCYCEAAFARRNISVVQAIYSRPNNPSLMNPGS
jgi:cyclopropane-fatty-acyl-phospholipid synthase